MDDLNKEFHKIIATHCENEIFREKEQETLLDPELRANIIHEFIQSGEWHDVFLFGVRPTDKEYGKMMSLEWKRRMLKEKEDRKAAKIRREIKKNEKKIKVERDQREAEEKIQADKQHKEFMDNLTKIIEKEKKEKETGSRRTNKGYIIDQFGRRMVPGRVGPTPDSHTSPSDREAWFRSAFHGVEAPHYEVTNPHTGLAKKYYLDDFDKPGLSWVK